MQQLEFAMRPQSIIWFERIYLGTLALSLVNTISNWPTIIAASRAASNPSVQIDVTAFAVAIMLFTFIISMLFWYFIARRASKAAKWILVVFTVLGLLGLPSALSNPMYGIGMRTWTILGTLLNLAAIALLFHPTARDWFNGKSPADPNVFD